MPPALPVVADFVGNHYGEWVLDTHYPAYPEPYTSTPGNAGKYDAYGSNETAKDTPADSLTSSFSNKGTHCYFKTYIMFLPPGNNSRYVPLKVVSWEYQFDAVNGPTGWQLKPNLDENGKDKPRQTISAPIETSDHPVWIANWFPLSWKTA